MNSPNLNSAPVTKSLAYQSFPAVYRHADASAIRYRRRYSSVVVSFVLFSVAAPICELLLGSNRQALATSLLIATFAQLGVALINAGSNQSKGWYESRAVAESTKSLTWRFAVGGSPFGIPQIPSRQSDVTQFSIRLMELVNAFHEHGMAFDSTEMVLDEDISELITLRHSSLLNRQETYRQGRLEEQLRWYVGKAQQQGKQARKLNFLTVLVSLTAVTVAAIATSGQASDLLLKGISTLSASALGFLAFSKSQSYSLNASAYQLASYEIRLILGQQVPTDENEWAEWVDQAEEALSREHVMWQTSKSVRSGLRRSQQ